MFPKVVVRRGVNVAHLAKRGAIGFFREFSDAFSAHRRGELREHARERGVSTGKALRGAVTDAGRQVNLIRGALQDDPGNAAPRMLVGTLAFLAASGGPDADGGVPDLDIQLLGIGSHRSLLSHSIVAGAVIETLLYGLAKVVGMLHQHLPSNHDPLWDTIHRNKDAYLSAAAMGAGAGVAYHLLIDATVQPGTYHGLPVSLPAEAHLTILGVNAGMEALDVPRKNETFSKAGRTPRNVPRKRKTKFSRAPQLIEGSS